MGLAFHTLQCQHQGSLLQPCQLAHPALARALTGPDNNCYMGGLSIGLGLQTASSLRGGKEGVEHGHMHFSLPQLGSQEGPLTCGGVGVDEVLAPDIISSVMSLPPWFGSRIRICPRIRAERGSCWQAVGHSTWATPFPSAQHPQDTLSPKGKGRFIHCGDCPGHTQSGDQWVPHPLTTGHSVPQTLARSSALQAITTGSWSQQVPRPTSISRSQGIPRHHCTGTGVAGTPFIQGTVQGTSLSTQKPQ